VRHVENARRAFDLAANMMEVAAKYRALRASVLRLWRQDLPQPSIHNIDDITRFNESMDQSLSAAVESDRTFASRIAPVARAATFSGEKRRPRVPSPSSPAQAWASASSLTWRSACQPRTSGQMRWR
jgi:hypothetical protein